jgi:branched-chain amino acid transport system substrate-binding protein
MLSAIGCDVFDEQLERRVAAQQSAERECDTHADCAIASSAASLCVEPGGRCAAVESEDCKLVEGELGSDTIVLGALLATSGPTAATNLARQKSAQLAVREINGVGGVPGVGASGRHVALVACDAAVDVRRAARHLVDDLRLPAIVGPNTSQDTIDVSSEISARGGALLMSPTAVASSIASLNDAHLTWVMVSSDEQRAPLMRRQIVRLEEQLRAARVERPIRLSVIYRQDALGLGTRVGLNPLVLNGQTLLQNQTASPPTVVLEPYDSKLPNQDAIVERQVAFAPDIVVLGGTAEAIEEIMVPLEQRWEGSSRPYYLLIDSLRGPELLTTVAGSDELRRRIRGIGTVPTKRSAEVHDAFRLAYQTEYPGELATATGMGPSYDAVHAIAFAIAARHSEPVTGASIARGLARLHGGELEVPVESTKILSAFHELSLGRSIDAVGTYGAFNWDSRGAPLGGSVEVWCIAGGAQPRYESSGLTFDLGTLRSEGADRDCDQ